MAEDKSGLYITMIVGIVAVLALVMLYMGSGNSLAASDSPTGAVFADGADLAYSVGEGDQTEEGWDGSYVNEYAHAPCEQRYVQTVSGRIEVTPSNYVYVGYCSGWLCFLDGEQVPAGYACEDGQLNNQEGYNPNVY